MSAESPELVRAMRLLDQLTAKGFQFVRTAPGQDGPLLGRRVTDRWVEVVYLEGFSQDCLAWRQHRSPLLLPGQGTTDHHIEGGALSVLGEVATWDSTAERRPR